MKSMNRRRFIGNGLCAAAGWMAVSKVFGQVASDTAKPDWKAIKTKLIELARKYDRAA